MPLRDQYLSQTLAVAMLTLAVAMPAAQANDDEGRGKSQHAQINVKWQQECSACHIAYPPGFLSAESWRKVMGGLDKHFGTDASLTQAEVKEITDFLVSNASSRWSPTTAPLRITETEGFKRQHNSREVPAAVWKHPKVKSPANCQACHTKAESGDFSERNIKMPK